MTDPLTNSTTPAVPMPAQVPSPQTPRRRGRAPILGRVLQLVSFALLATVILLALGEVAARLVGGEIEATPYRPHPFLARVRTPGFKQTKMSVDDPPRSFVFEIDPLGFRGKSVTTAKKAPGTYRVFFVGASTTENQQLEEERTFPGLVEKALDDRSKGAPRIEVANTGIVGYGIDRDFALIAHQVLELEPDVIVVNDGGIDMIASLGENWDPAMLKIAAYSWSLREALEEQSRLVALFDSKFSTKDVDMRRRSFDKKRKLAHEKPYYTPEGLDLKRGLGRFRDYVRRIALICEDAQVPVYFLTQASLWKKDMSQAELDSLWMGGAVIAGKISLKPEQLADLMAVYNEAIEVEGRKHGGHVIDVASRVPRDLDHFIDDAHLTAAGNEVVAKAVLEAIWPGETVPRPLKAPEGSR